MMVPLPTAIGVPNRTLVLVLKLIPAGRAPTTAYVGMGLPMAAGTVIGLMAWFCVHVCASPVSSANDRGASTSGTAKAHKAFPALTE